MAARKPTPAKADAGASADASADAPDAAARQEELMRAYRDMLLIRRFEERAGQLYGMGLIGGFCHLYIGQEAVVVGLTAAAEDGDQTTTSYRDHGHMLACGMDPRGVMAELTGRSDGYSGGKGGSMHMFSRDKAFFGGHGIVGGQVPIGAGLGFANKYLENGKVSLVYFGDGAANQGQVYETFNMASLWKFGGHGIVGGQVPIGAGIGFANKYLENGKVSLVYFGDGAANQGQVYETFNMASLWKLPVVFVIENNQYAMGTSMARGSSTPALYTRGAAFGIPGEAVDGMDFDAVKQAGLKALAHCRGGDGPYILEMNTYRYRGHSMSDPAKYRTREEVTKMRDEKDPIEHVRKQLIALGVADEALKEVDKAVKAQVNEAAQFAQDSPEPDAAALWTDIYASA